MNQERRHYKKRSNEHNYMSLVVRKPVSLRKHVDVIYSNISWLQKRKFRIKNCDIFLILLLKTLIVGTR